MGNHHGSISHHHHNHHHATISHQTSIDPKLPANCSSRPSSSKVQSQQTIGAFSRLKLAELRGLRRQSMPADQLKQDLMSMGGANHISTSGTSSNSHANHQSFTFGDSVPGSANNSIPRTPPRIQINGRDSKEEEVDDNEVKGIDNCTNVGATHVGGNIAAENKPLPLNAATERIKHRAQKTDSRKMTASKRRIQLVRTATERRSDYYSTNASVDSNKDGMARSLDLGNLPPHFANADLQLEMRPLSVRSARSMSPLKQLRGLYRSGSRPSTEENVLTKEQSDLIERSWRRAKVRIDQYASDRCFGFFVFDRIFEKAADLRSVFGIDADAKILELPDSHHFIRHSRLFNSIIDLAVRNIEELESEIAPALFTYGKRHYQPKLMEKFTELNVRLFCSQTVCTMVDLLGDELSPMAVEAWIELMTYIGRTLLSGFENERSLNSKRGSAASMVKIKLDKR